MSITTSHLEYFRKQSAKILPDTCQIVRMQSVSDNAGGTIETVQLIGSYPCRISPAGISNSERSTQQGETTFQGWFLTLSVGTDIRLDDQVNVNGGRIYEVLGMDKDRSYAVSLRVSVAEIKG